MSSMVAREIIDEAHLCFERDQTPLLVLVARELRIICFEFDTDTITSKVPYSYHCLLCAIDRTIRLAIRSLVNSSFFFAMYVKPRCITLT